MVLRVRGIYIIVNYRFTFGFHMDHFLALSAECFILLAMESSLCVLTLDSMGIIDRQLKFRHLVKLLGLFSANSFKDKSFSFNGFISLHHSLPFSLLIKCSSIPIMYIA
jgi:hypothetical protein